MGSAPLGPRYSFQQYIDIRAAHLETIQALALALDAKDPYTRGHSERVAEYAAEIAVQMKLPENEVEMLRYAGVLHDIGKIGISDTVLNKVGKLTDAEFELIQSHTTIGAHVVKPVGFLRGVSLVIRHHHERYDGRGYPDGLQGEEIPLGARIMAVADAFDAMTYDRVYRAGIDTDQAVPSCLKGGAPSLTPTWSTSLSIACFLRRSTSRVTHPSSAGPIGRGLKATNCGAG